MSLSSRALGALVIVCMLAGCAAPGRRPDPRDPFERLNRSTFALNEALDRAAVRPVARAYRKVVPRPVQTGITHFFSNAKYPVVIANDVLQGKLRPAGNDTLRFLMNTTFGLAGLLDPATSAGLDRNDEDFGQTLGRWGVHAGPYIVVPLLGPYTVRDGFGSLFDDFTEPRHYLEDDSTRWELWAGSKLERRVRLLDADAVLDRAGDKYAFVRSAYLQRREYQVRDGEVAPEEAPAEDEPADDTADDTAADAPDASAATTPTEAPQQRGDTPAPPQ